MSSSQIQIDNPAPAKRLKGEWKLEFGGTSYSENRQSGGAPDEGAAAALQVVTKFDYSFFPFLTLHFEPTADLYSGRLQQRYDNDVYDNRVGVRAAYLSLKPLKFAEGRAGAIDQDYLYNPLLISEHRAFPGAQAILSTETAPVTVKLMAQQLIPTSYSLNTERTEKEVLPSFSTENVIVEGKHPGLSEWKLFAGHFAWSRLPDKVNSESALAGNSYIGGEVVPGTRLAYGFEGLHWGAKACLCLTGPVGFEAEYYGIRNTLAPGSARDGQLIGGGPVVHLPDDQELRLFFATYFLESDATVARYAKSRIGFTNRMGEAIDAEWKFKKQGFKINGRWTNARTVANTDRQGTLSLFYLGVETEYAPF